MHDFNVWKACFALLINLENGNLIYIMKKKPHIKISKHKIIITSHNLSNLTND